MGIMLNREDDQNAELTRRIDADLREKMEASSKSNSEQKDPDFAEDSEYVKELSKTGKYAWIWVVVGAVVVVGLIIFGLNKH